MTIQEITDALTVALQLRPPTFPPDTPPRTKIAALEDYLLASAYAAAELEEALWWLDQLVSHYATEVEEITGYEVALPRKARDRITQADIDRAKRVVTPEPFELGAQAKLLRENARRQIDRLRHEQQWTISRAYTFITGS